MDIYNVLTGFPFFLLAQVLCNGSRQCNGRKLSRQLANTLHPNVCAQVESVRSVSPVFQRRRCHSWWRAFTEEG